MKKNEIIELNGVEYTLELNRDSFVQIDKICNVTKTMNILKRGLYEYVDEIDDDYDPFANLPTDEDIEKEVSLKEECLKKFVTHSLFIWLYPNHKLPISKVKEIVKPYLEDTEKSDFIANKVGDLLGECVAIRQDYVNEQKNLKPLTNKN